MCNQLSCVDKCYNLIKNGNLDKDAKEAIKDVIYEREKYFILYEIALAHSVNDTFKNKRKLAEELDLLNEGWKQDSIKLDLIRKLLEVKLEELNNPNDNRWETDEEHHTRLVTEIRLLKDILELEEK